MYLDATAASRKLLRRLSAFEMQTNAPRRRLEWAADAIVQDARPPNGAKRTIRRGIMLRARKDNRRYAAEIAAPSIGAGIKPRFAVAN